MAPQPETGKSGWLKLATACYYCLASMTVQYMNKVGPLLQKTASKGVCFSLCFTRLHHEVLPQQCPTNSDICLNSASSDLARARLIHTPKKTCR